MIKQYQKRFVRIMMSSLFLILIVVLSLTNLLNYIQMKQETQRNIDFLIHHDGKMPQPLPKKEGRPNSTYDLRYFTVSLEDEQILSINTSHILSVSSAMAYEYTEQILTEHSTDGVIDDYMYRVTENQNQRFIVFMDIHHQKSALQSFFMSTLWIAIGSLLILFVIVVLASKRAIFPLIESIEKQKRFITDAGHEIKTPLAIISANNEVLEIELGENEWIKSNQNQIARLNDLIGKLLLLSKMEESDEMHTELMDIGICMNSVLDEFKPLFEQHHIVLTKTIHDHVICNADQKQVQTLFRILIENAVKYSSEPYEIILSCIQRGRKAEIEIFNTCKEIPAKVELLFDRFYRADESHSSQISGQGIGLSIAHAIVKAHHGKIVAEAKENGLLFKIEL